jgi:thiol-disulfide isomerase/thioredoxin
MRKSKYKLLAFLVVFVVSIGIISCRQPATPTSDKVPEWMKIELTDIATGQTFTIGDFGGKPILLESFAVWCPTCLAQQNQMKNLLESEGEDIIHISLDTDPNEDEDIVRDHIARHNLNWYFAVAPAEFTNALIDQFGLDVVSAPRAPVVLICEDQSTRFLRSGVKSAEELASEIDKGCE